jgi:TRAP-type C4-dicarboxylate transport system permease large subunit
MNPNSPVRDRICGRNWAVIPPSIPMVIYGNGNSLSVSCSWAASCGLMLGAGL